MIKTRFAPSPTGTPHLGNIRTAFFSWLWARQNKGQFLVRIEDTDQSRVVPGSKDEIIEILNWLNLDFDGEILTQSQELNYYQEIAQKLVTESKAYLCFCSSEELQAQRLKQQKEKKAPRYSQKCRNLTQATIDDFQAKKIPFVIRLKVPNKGEISFNDLVHGKISFNYAVIDDQVLLKSDGYPTYHLAAIVDDHRQGITQVIRGEEWISSTPKHICLQQALNYKTPEYAHLPIILGADRSKLSKRHGATSVLHYKETGILPEPLLNFLILLGWHPQGNQELFTINEIISNFKWSEVQKSPAIFDNQKLNWFNQNFIKNLKIETLMEITKNNLPAEYLKQPELLKKALLSVQNRLKSTSNLAAEIDFYFTAPTKIEKELLIGKTKLTIDQVKTNLELGLNLIKKIKDQAWTHDQLLATFIKFCQENNLKRGELLWPIRVALSGKNYSPGVFEIAIVLGRGELIKRLEKVVESL